MPGSAPERRGSHEGLNVESILGDANPLLPKRYFGYNNKIKDKVSPNNTANAVVADRFVWPLSLEDQHFAQFAETLDAIL